MTVQSSVVMQETQDELQFICGRDVYMQTAVQRIRPPDHRFSQAGVLFCRGKQRVQREEETNNTLTHS